MHFIFLAGYFPYIVGQFFKSLTLKKSEREVNKNEGSSNFQDFPKDPPNDIPAAP